MDEEDQQRHATIHHLLNLHLFFLWPPDLLWTTPRKIIVCRTGRMTIFPSVTAMMVVLSVNNDNP